MQYIIKKILNKFIQSYLELKKIGYFRIDSQNILSLQPDYKI